MRRGVDQHAGKHLHFALPLSFSASRRFFSLEEALLVLGAVLPGSGLWCEHVMVCCCLVGPGCCGLLLAEFVQPDTAPWNISHRQKVYNQFSSSASEEAPPNSSRALPH